MICYIKLTFIFKGIVWDVAFVVIPVNSDLILIYTWNSIVLVFFFLNDYYFLRCEHYNFSIWWLYNVLMNVELSFEHYFRM